MIIFSIETSCDETAVAVTRNGREVLSDAVFSQADMHALYGGVVPEIASRNHVAVIARLADSAMGKAGITKAEIDAVAVTYAPGLIGALLVGVNFAKGLALSLGVPLIPVHHIRGHIAANYIAYPELEPPFLSLIVSGGNSLLADVRGYTDIRILGSTRDDAAGECFDKVARVLGLPYPGGRPLDELSQGGDDTAFDLPRAKMDGYPYDMSFSGLKTAVVNIVHNAEQKAVALDKASLAASFARAVSDTLVPRTMAAAKALGYDKLVVAGGVAANSRIRRTSRRWLRRKGRRFLSRRSSCAATTAQ
jgi:N6-L-threonylcarbamoyladenine synthase